MKAIIMAGGQGTRLRPLTSNQPKPMIRIANLPCMEHIVNLLSRHGFTDVGVTLQFMPDEIRDYFGDGADWGVNMRYSIEDAPPGTAGSVKMAEEQLGLHGERLLIISGDALTDADLTQVVRFHEEKDTEVTMVLKSVENPLDFGIVITEEDGRISRFLEKPAWGQVFSDTVNTGIYLLEPSATAEIPDPEEGEYDFSKELFPKLLDAGRPLYGYITEDYWEDIGTLEQFASAQRDVLDGRAQGIRPPGTRLRENIYVGRRAQVDDDELEGPVVIEDNAGSDPDDVEILFFSADATPITEGEERSVEKAFVREEYRRAYGGDIGELIYPGRVVEQFVERLERAVDRQKTSGATIVVDFCGGVAGLVASRVFSRLGVGAVVMEGFANANAVRAAGGMNLEESIERVARIVPTVDAAFGAVVGPEAEFVQFVDDEGEWVPNDVMLACLIEGLRPQEAVFPINLSREYERLVEEGGGTVQMSRTGLGNVPIKAAEGRAHPAPPPH